MRFSVFLALNLTLICTEWSCLFKSHSFTVSNTCYIKAHTSGMQKAYVHSTLHTADTTGFAWGCWEYIMYSMVTRINSETYMQLGWQNTFWISKTLVTFTWCCSFVQSHYWMLLSLKCDQAANKKPTWKVWKSCLYNAVFNGSVFLIGLPNPSLPISHLLVFLLIWINCEGNT